MMADWKWANWEKESNVAIITIDHPPANALARPVAREIIGCLNEIAKEPAVRAVVITGAGDKFFIGGGDIKTFPEQQRMEMEELKAHIKVGHETFNTIENFSKPVIAAINGMALGGGCEVAIACDLRIAAENTVLGLPEIKLGLFPGGGGTQRLPRLIGKSKALELMLLGESISAREALSIGLVNMVIPEGQALKKAKEIAQKIAGRSRTAISAIKEAVNRGIDVPKQHGLDIEIDLFARVFKSENASEGVSAFIEKRAPQFK